MKFSILCAAAAAVTTAAQQIVVPTVTLANGVNMPAMAAGVGGDNDTDATSSILSALSLGILSVDAAQDYMNLGHYPTGTLRQFCVARKVMRGELITALAKLRDAAR